MDKKIIKIIMILILIIIFLSIIILLLFYNQEKKTYEEEIYYNPSSTKREKFALVKEQTEFLDTYVCINNYIGYISQLYREQYYNQEYESSINIEEYIDEQIKIAEEEIFSILDEKYIEESDININSIADLYSNYYGQMKFVIDKMYALDNSDDVSTYIIYGNIINLTKNENKEYSLMVRRDMNNLTYSILPHEYIINNNYIESNIQNIDISVLKNNKEQIESNTYNTYSPIVYDDEYIAKYYFNDYKDRLMYNVESLFYNLNEEYREKRFKNIDEYKNYVNENYQNLLKCFLSKYQYVYNEDTSYYICIDNYDNYYIFTEKEGMNYELILDTYTIDLPEFLESYNSTNNQGKTALNIQKFIQAINAKDYSYAYSKLADSFKNNYFNTEKDFEEYINNKLFSHNSIQFNTFSVQGDVNSYKIILTDQTGNSTDEISLNIVMQLQEGTDFVMSFEV